MNKVETGVRLRHKPTGIIIDNTETRSQLGNKEKAIQLLKSQLYEMEMAKRSEARAEIEAGKKKIEWGSQIRSYVLQPYKMVKDLRSSYETSNTDAVLSGEIEPMLKANLIRKWALEYDTLHIVTGPIHQYSGYWNSDIPIPSGYWKAVLRVRPDTAAIAFIIPNERRHLGSYQNYQLSIDSLEAQIEVDLFHSLEDNIEILIESEIGRGFE